MNFRSELLSAQNEVKYQNETMRKALTAALRAQVLPETMSFSAGIPPLDVVSQHREEVLTDEVQQQKDEVGIYKAWIRQMDEMYNEELKASSQSRGGSQEKEQKKIGDNNPNDKDFYYPKKPCPPGPPGPANDPGGGGGGGDVGPPDPPGLPSLRGSQRNSQDDELSFTVDLDPE